MEMFVVYDERTHGGREGGRGRKALTACVYKALLAKPLHTHTPYLLIYSELKIKIDESLKLPSSTDATRALATAIRIILNGFRSNVKWSPLAVSAGAFTPFHRL